MKTYASTLLFILILRVGLLFAQLQALQSRQAWFSESDGSRLYYEECGSGPKAVVLLHDGVVNSAVWDDVWPHSANSSTPFVTTAEATVARRPRRSLITKPMTLRRSFSIARSPQAALVASSHGGDIALNFALRYPAQVIELVLIGPEAEGFPYSEHFVNGPNGVSGREGCDRSAGSKYLFYPFRKWRCARAPSEASQCRSSRP